MTILEKLVAFAAILVVGLEFADNKGWISLSNGWSLLLSVAIPVLLVAMLY